MKNTKISTRFFTVIAIIAGMFLSLNLFPQDTEQDPLYDATIRASVDGVKQALAEGADINRQSDNGYTALMWACSWASRPGYSDVAKYLIEAGADVNAKTADGKTPLSLAGSSNAEITEILKKAGAK
jgi:ankyrin repeat protein